LRLAGLDAQLDGTCAAGQPCASFPAARATAALTALALGQRLSCEADRPYNRSITFCMRADGVDLSCAMLAGGYAARSGREWDAHACPS
jgi:endonuclease YncB( thermonuclease family)